MTNKIKKIAILIIVSLVLVVIFLLFNFSSKKPEASITIVELPKSISDNFVQSTKGNILFGNNFDNPGITGFIGLAKEEKWLDRSDLSKVKEYAHVQKFLNTETNLDHITIDYYRFDKDILIEKYYADNYYFDFASALNFASTVLKEDLPKYEGKKEYDKKFEKYDLSTRQERLDQLQSEQLKTKTMLTACKLSEGYNTLFHPASLMFDLTEDNKNLLQEATEFKPTTTFTEEEYLACHKATHQQDLTERGYEEKLVRIRQSLEIYNQLVREKNEKR